MRLSSSPYLPDLSYRQRAAMRRDTESSEARAKRITAPSAREVALRRMAPDVAAERTAGDIAGRNWHPDKPQRGPAGGPGR